MITRLAVFIAAVCLSGWILMETGGLYRASSRSTFTIVKSQQKVPEIPIMPDLDVGEKVPPFVKTALDGRKISFPAQYKGKLVLLDLWQPGAVFVWSKCRISLGVFTNRPWILIS